MHAACRTSCTKYRKHRAIGTAARPCGPLCGKSSRCAETSVSPLIHRYPKTTGSPRAACPISELRLVHEKSGTQKKTLTISLRPTVLLWSTLAASCSPQRPLRRGEGSGKRSRVPRSGGELSYFLTSLARAAYPSASYVDRSGKRTLPRRAVCVIEQVKTSTRQTFAVLIRSLVLRRPSEPYADVSAS